MRKAVLIEKERLILEDVPIPSCGPGEVLVRVAFAGICRTDRKAYHMGQRDLHIPRVLGHEISGYVEAIGKGVGGYAVGQKVQIHPGLFCGRCSACKQGFDQICPEMEILGFHLDGGFQEVCRIPAKGVAAGIVNLLPDRAKLDAAVLAEPLACAIHMVERLRPVGKDRLLIIGGGVLGILTAKLWVYRQRGPVTIAEKSESRIALGRKLGFETVPLDNVEMNAYETAIPCCPQNDGFNLAVSALTPRGQLGFFSGLTAEDAPKREIVNQLHYKELALFGAYGCGQRDTKLALDLLLGDFPVGDLPMRVFGLEELEEVLADLDSDRGLIKLLQIKK